MRRPSIAPSFLWVSPLLLLAGCAGGGQLVNDPVEEQLAADHVIPGSALEQLIRENQDFATLRPEESATDTIGIPLWQRVMYRREHPEQVFSGDDPTGGYPRALKDAHLWMVHHQDLRRGEPEPDVQPGALAALETEQSAVSPTGAAIINANVRTSGAQTTPRSESAIQVNYWNTAKIIAASNSFSASGNQAQFYSSDGGATWAQTTLPYTSNDLFHFGPSVDWTSDGAAWSMTLGSDLFGLSYLARAYKSTNGGATWTFDGTPSGSQTSVDKEVMWVDHSATSPYKNTIYAIWHNGTPAYVGRRTGGVWQTPLKMSGSETTGTAIGGDIKTNSAGEVFAFWPDTGTRKIFARKSTNGGAAFSAAVTVRTTFGSYDIGVPSFASRRALIYVSGGAYKTATKNLVYAAWADLSGAPGCTAAANEPGTTVASTCKTRIWFARSTDGGATWGAAIKVNDQASLNDQYNQWLAVDETTGRIGLIYHDTVGNAGRLKTDVWYQSSADDGITWGAAAKVTTAMTDETAATADPDNQYGDYNGLSGYGGVFFPSWTDRRNNAKEEIWTAKITEPAPAPSDACTPTPYPLAVGAIALAAGTTVGMADNFESFCADSSPATTAPDVVYAFTLPQEGTFKVKVSSRSGALNPAVYLQQTCGTDYACFNFGATTETVAGDFPAGTYYVVVDGASKTSGDFQLEASFNLAKCGDGVVNPGEQCDTGPGQAGDGCGDPGTATACKYDAPLANADKCPGTPVSIGAGTTILPASSADSTNGYANDYSGSCSYPPGGADRVYAVTPTAAGNLTVSVGYGANGTTDICAVDVNNPGCWDRALYARTTCADASPAAELGCSDKGAFDVETITFAVTAGKTYYVFVDGFDDQAYSSGPYNLVFKLQ